MKGPKNDPADPGMTLDGHWVGDDDRGAAARHTRHARMTPSIKGPNQITVPRLIKSLKLLRHDKSNYYATTLPLEG